MNRLAAILPLQQVLVDVEITSKKRAFEEIGLLFENLHGLKRSTITDSLLARERMGSTGLGYGVAVPHGRIKGLKQAHAAVLRLQNTIAFEAIDGQPVRLLIALLIPDSNAQLHLEVLSDIAQMLGDAKLRQQLMDAPDAPTLHALIHQNA